MTVAHAEHGLTASAGNPAHHSFVRSAIKMFQVLPFVEAGGADHFGLTPEELALCTASHGGEPFHVAAAQSILAKAKLTRGAWRQPFMGCLIDGPRVRLSLYRQGSDDYARAWTCCDDSGC